MTCATKSNRSTPRPDLTASWETFSTIAHSLLLSAWLHGNTCLAFLLLVQLSFSVSFPLLPIKCWWLSARWPKVASLPSPHTLPEWPLLIRLKLSFKCLSYLYFQHKCLFQAPNLFVQLGIKYIYQRLSETSNSKGPKLSSPSSPTNLFSPRYFLSHRKTINAPIFPSQDHRTHWCLSFLPHPALHSVT